MEEDIPQIFATLSQGQQLQSAGDTLLTRIEGNPGLPTAIL